MELVPNEACTFVARGKELLLKYLEHNDIYNDGWIEEAIILLEYALEKLTSSST